MPNLNYNLNYNAGNEGSSDYFTIATMLAGSAYVLYQYRHAINDKYQLTDFFKKNNIDALREKLEKNLKDLPTLLKHKYYESDIKQDAALKITGLFKDNHTRKATEAACILENARRTQAARCIQKNYSEYKEANAPYFGIFG